MTVIQLLVTGVLVYIVCVGVGMHSPLCVYVYVLTYLSYNIIIYL